MPKIVMYFINLEKKPLLLINDSVAMVAAFMTNAHKSTYLTKEFSLSFKKKHRCADLNNTHSEIIKTIDFKGTTKEYIQDRINAFIIKEKIVDKNK